MSQPREILLPSGEDFVPESGMGDVVLRAPRRRAIRKNENGNR